MQKSLLPTSPPVPSSGSVSCTSSLIKVDLPETRREGLSGGIRKEKGVVPIKEKIISEEDKCWKLIEDN